MGVFFDVYSESAFFIEFVQFFIDFGVPLGDLFFQKNVKNGLPSLGQTPFSSNVGSLGPLFRKNIDFYPLDPHFGDIFGDFLVKKY